MYTAAQSSRSTVARLSLARRPGVGRRGAVCPTPGPGRVRWRPSQETDVPRRAPRTPADTGGAARHRRPTSDGAGSSLRRAASEEHRCRATLPLPLSQSSRRAATHATHTSTHTHAIVDIHARHSHSHRHSPERTDGGTRRAAADGTSRRAAVFQRRRPPPARHPRLLPTAAANRTASEARNNTVYERATRALHYRRAAPAPVARLSLCGRAARRPTQTPAPARVAPLVMILMLHTQSSVRLPLSHSPAATQSQSTQRPASRRPAALRRPAGRAAPITWRSAASTGAPRGRAPRGSAGTASRCCPPAGRLGCSR